MTDIKKPIQTEYKGIVFSSKSEAVFARTLDIANAMWVYHPPIYCNHSWDFIVTPATRPKVPTLVAYKSQMPSNDYVDNLVSLMKATPYESVVVWGNPWDGIDMSIDGSLDCCYRVYPIFSSYAKYGWGDFVRFADNGGDWPTSFRHDTFGVLGIKEDMVQQAKTHKFRYLISKSPSDRIAPNEEI